MKKPPTRYVLAAELVTIFLFHLVKIKQAEKHLSDTVFTPTVKNMPIHKPVVENKTGFEYMLVNLIK